MKNVLHGLDLPFTVGTSPTLKIRGIIATRKIKAKEIIERCPLIFSDIKNEEEYLKKTVLWKYYYEWNREHHCIVLGYGGLINHSFQPNTKYTFDYKNRLLVYRALKEILPGEEITVNYNWEPHSQDPLPTELTDFNKHFKK